LEKPHRFSFDGHEARGVDLGGGRTRDDRDQHQLGANRLVSIATEEEFTELPYVVINITRYKRYPKTDTPLRNAVSTVDKHAEHVMKEAKEELALLAPFRDRYAKVQKIVKAPPPPPTQAGPPIALPMLLPNAPPEDSVLKKWWFWTAIGTAAAAGVALPIMLRKTETYNRGFVVGP
jgi:hypothetical protein